jgi:hypothetical protein
MIWGSRLAEVVEGGEAVGGGCAGVAEGFDEGGGILGRGERAVADSDDLDVAGRCKCGGGFQPVALDRIESKNGHSQRHSHPE